MAALCRRRRCVGGRRQHLCAWLGGQCVACSVRPARLLLLLPPASTQLVSGPEAVLARLAGHYLHITLAVAPGGEAKEAAQLEAWVAGGRAVRAALPEVLVLEGQVMGVA